MFATAEGGRRRVAAVLASTSDAVIVTDQTERILLISRATERLFHLKANDVIGRPVADVLQVEPLVSALTGDDEHVQNLEIPANDDKTYYASASTIISNDGQVMGRVAVLHDITHYKEVDEMKSDFVATVSHDLRSPLTFMRGYATMLPMVGELNEKQGEYAEKILSGIDQMSHLVDDLLDLGRIEAGVELQNERIELPPLLADIANEHWQHAHMSGIRLQVDVEPELPIVHGDSALIRQAITNLVHNGIKYAPNSGTMELRAEQLDGDVVISVQDHGPGIPKEAQIRLFEKFFRIKRRGTEKVKGSGLGLAIVKSIAERHGGVPGAAASEDRGVHSTSPYLSSRKKTTRSRFTPQPISSRSRTACNGAGSSAWKVNSCPSDGRFSVNSDACRKWRPSRMRCLRRP
jgi:PAS domain S-box-containing protein